MRQPLHKACLMNKLDTSAAFTGVKQLFFVRPLSTTYATSIRILVAVVLHFHIVGEVRVA